MHIIGVDPGLNGGIAELNGDVIDGNIMPTITYELKNGKRRKRYDMKVIRNIFSYADMQGDLIVYIEKQFPMPLSFKRGDKQASQGATSLFSIGHGYGLLCGLLCGLGIQTESIAPKTWQNAMFKRDKTKTTKQQAYEALKSIYPDANPFPTQRSKKPHDGVVDAMCIAEYGRRRRMEEE